VTRPAGSPRAVAALFALAGVTSAAAFSRVPSLRSGLHATAAQMGFALVCVGLGSLLLMPFTGRLTERWTSRVVVRFLGVLALIGWAAAAYAPSVPLLALALLVTGVGVGTWDVAMNIQGHTVEQRQARVLMPRWHAMFSYGAVAGAALGAGCARADVSVRVQFPVLSALSLVVLWSSTAAFVSDEPAAPIADEPSAVRRGITRAEILIGLMVLCTALGEGAANDWLGLTLVDTRGLPEAFGALALAGFNLTMATARILSGQLLTRLGRVPVLQLSGLVAAGGVTLLCLVDSPVAAAVGAMGWGLGLAVVFPSGISAAGGVPGRGARAISVVSTIGYGGFLLGAPLIGQLTRVVRLDRALLVVAGAALLIVVVAPAAREISGEEPAVTAGPT
jgi:MFS family permease